MRLHLPQETVLPPRALLPMHLLDLVGDKTAFVCKCASVLVCLNVKAVAFIASKMLLLT